MMPSKLSRFPEGAYPPIPFEANASLSRLVRLLVESHPPAKNPAHGPVVIKEFLRYVLTDIRSIFFPKKMLMLALIVLFSLKCYASLTSNYRKCNIAKFLLGETWSLSP